MRALTGLTVFAAGIAAGAALLSLKNTPAYNFKDVDFKEVVTKMSQVAGPVLKDTLPFITAFIATGFVAVLSTFLVATKVHPFLKDHYIIDEAAYKTLSTPQKIRNFTVLTLAGTTAGAGFGSIVIKAATVFLQLSPRYVKNSAIALTTLGAGIGALMGLSLHFQGTQEPYKPVKW